MHLSFAMRPSVMADEGPRAQYVFRFQDAAGTFYERGFGEFLLVKRDASKPVQLQDHAVAVPVLDGDSRDMRVKLHWLNRGAADRDTDIPSTVLTLPGRWQQVGSTTSYECTEAAAPYAGVRIEPFAVGHEAQRNTQVAAINLARRQRIQSYTSAGYVVAEIGANMALAEFKEANIVDGLEHAPLEMVIVLDPRRRLRTECHLMWRLTDRLPADRDLRIMMLTDMIGEGIKGKITDPTVSVFPGVPYVAFCLIDADSASR